MFSKDVGAWANGSAISAKEGKYMSSVRNAVIVLTAVGTALAAILRKAYKIGQKKINRQEKKK